MKEDLVFENEMIKEVKKAKFKPNTVLQILIFFLIFYITSILQVVAIIPFMVPGIFTNPEAMEKLMTNESYILLSLWICIVNILAPILYCVCIEKRNGLSMGFQKKGIFVSYLKGLVIGTILIFAALGIGYIVGAFQYEGLGNGNIAIILLYIIGFIVQSMSEEVLVRGYLMNSLTNRIGAWGAILVSALIFSLLHLGNEGFGIYSFISIFLMGIFLGMYILKTGNIWGASAIHFAWNFIQGVFLGIPVSGMPIQSTVFRFRIVEVNNPFVNQTFGIEGGLDCMLVLGIACIILFASILIKNKKKMVTEKAK